MAGLEGFLFTNMFGVFLFFAKAAIRENHNTMDPSDVSMGQLKVRYRRCHELLATLRDLLSKVLISVEILETNSNSLREQNEFLCHQNPGHLKTIGKKDLSKARTPSSSEDIVDMTLTTLEKIQAKLAEFEKIAFSQRTAIEKVKEEHCKLKVKLEEVQRNFQRETKKNAQLQGIIKSMENKSKRDATSRDVAKRRLGFLANEIRELIQGLSTEQRSNRMSNSQQEKSNNADQSFNSTALVPVVTSTPRNPYRDCNCGEYPFDDIPFKKNKLAIRFPLSSETDNAWTKRKKGFSTLASLTIIFIVCLSISSLSTYVRRVFF